MPHPARCWRCVVLAACWPYFSLLSLFPAFLPCLSCLSQHLWDPRSSLVPTCLLCIRAGGTRRWTAFCETPLRVFDYFSSHPMWQSQSHSPCPSQGVGEAPENPVLPQSRHTPFFFSSWFLSGGGTCMAPSFCRGILRGRAENGAHSCGMGHGAALGHCPSSRQKGKDSELNN